MVFFTFLRQCVICQFARLMSLVEESRLTANLHTTIRARAPLRLGLAGGGTDLSPYCDDFGGAVLNTTIDRYAYAFIGPSPDDRIHLHALDIGVTDILSADLSSPGKLVLHAGVAARMARTYGD